MNRALMKALAVLLLVALLGVAFLSVHAQAPEYLLSPDEKRTWGGFDEAEAANARALNEAIAAAINTAVGAASAEVHGRISQAGLALELVRARRAAWLADLRAREKCATCVIDNGKLVPPKDGTK